jgi:hypothetical protein
MTGAVERREAVIAEACLEPRLEAPQMAGDLGLDLGRANKAGPRSM